MQSGRPKRSRAKPPDAQLNNPRNPRWRDDSKGPERGFSVRACKTIMGSDTPQNYQGIQCAEIDQWVEGAKGECDLLQVNKTWELTELPQGQNVISGRWLHKEKKGFVKLKTWVKHGYFVIVLELAKGRRKWRKYKPAPPPPPPPPAT